MFGPLGRHPFGLAFAIVIVGLVAYTGFRLLDHPAQMAMGGRAVPVIVATARPIEFVDKIQAIGTAKANESVEVTAKVTDTVHKVNFEDGMEVKAGQVLVELTNAEESALLAEATATLAEAEQQYNRTADLVKRGSASRAKLDEQTRVRDAAKAQVGALRARLADRLIRAPFSGVLGFRQVSPGALITPGTVIATLDDVHIIKLDFAIPETYLAALKPGLKIEARSPTYRNRVFHGTVTTVNSRVDPATRAVTMRAEIDNPERLLRPGMLLTVEVIRDRQNALAVPEEALIPVQDRQFVYRVGKDNAAERVAVEIGRRRPGVVEITGGLNAGDRVVVEGAMHLRPGVTVDITKERSLPDQADAVERHEE